MKRDLFAAMNEVVKFFRQRWLLGLFGTLPFILTAQEILPGYSCVFKAKEWDSKDWIFVRRSDMENDEKWAQREGFIENENGHLNSHTSMIYRKKFKGDVTISSTMAFVDKQAPSIVIASKIGEDAKGRKEYQEHIEIVLFNEGINVWTHHTENGKPIWKQTSFSRFPLERNTKYKLQVTKRGKELSISAANHTFGYLENSLPKEFYVGVTACEGVNRFYDFAVTQQKN